jgi:hypothetical protein
LSEFAVVNCTQFTDTGEQGCREFLRDVCAIVENYDSEISAKEAVKQVFLICQRFGGVN